MSFEINYGAVAVHSLAIQQKDVQTFPLANIARRTKFVQSMIQNLAIGNYDCLTGLIDYWQNYCITSSRRLRVLDIGCGSGEIALYLTDFYCRPTMIDLSPLAVARSKRILKAQQRLYFLDKAYVGSVNILPNSTPNFDCAVIEYPLAFDVTGHLENSLSEELFPRIKGNGFLIAGFYGVHQTFKETTFRSIITAKKIRKFLDENGFVILRLKETTDKISSHTIHLIARKNSEYNFEIDDEGYSSDDDDILKYL